MSADEYPDFTYIDDGIMHSAGMSPVKCVCGKEMAECAIPHHTEVCSILHMQRVTYAKNHRIKPKK